jgi:hypothetical protein
LGLRAFLFSAGKTTSFFRLHSTNSQEVFRMAANAQQGTFLGTTLAGFTAYVAGRVAGGGLGMLLALLGVVLLILSAAGFYRLKSLG